MTEIALIKIRSGTISCGGNSFQVEPKVNTLLLYLAQKVGRVVGREKLFFVRWPGTVVSDDTLTGAVIKLRNATKREPSPSWPRLPLGNVML